MAEPQRALIVCGNAGAGKSTVARELARQHGMLLLDIDTCTERLVRVALRCRGLDEDDRDSDQYKELLREPVYETLFDIACANLPHASCIIVGPFTRERRLSDWPDRLRQRLGVPIEIVIVTCDKQERRRRIEARRNPRDRGKLDDWDNYAALGDDHGEPPFPHRAIDTTSRG